MFVKGEKVILREKRIEDAPEDYAWRVDEELARLDATRPLRMSYADFQRFSQEEMGYPSPRSKRLAIDTHDGTHIGNIMYYDIDLRRKESELGIMIGDRDYWGKGYGTDSVDSLLGHIFVNTEITRVYLHTLDWNERARKSFAKSGFKEVKKVRRSGMDFVLMEIWRSDWRPELVEDSANEDGEVSAEPPG
ncbi:MAG: GNAT family N-acetyltransferase [Chloroflexi bacterium]|nr:GNAT family N-acetyltransferase [Chloroflexota bacterium]